MKVIVQGKGGVPQEVITLTEPLTIIRGESMNRLHTATGMDHWFTVEGYYDGWGMSVCEIPDEGTPCFAVLVPLGFYYKAKETEEQLSKRKRDDTLLSELLDRIEMTLSVVPADQPNCASCDQMMKLMETEAVDALRKKLR